MTAPAGSESVDVVHDPFQVESNVGPGAENGAMMPPPGEAMIAPPELNTPPGAPAFRQFVVPVANSCSAGDAPPAWDIKYRLPFVARASHIVGEYCILNSSARDSNWIQSGEKLD